MSGATKAQLKQLHAQAMQSGNGPRFLAALEHILDQLHAAPTEFGEPLYELPALRLWVRQAVVAPLVVDYGVDQDQAVVFVRGFKVLSRAAQRSARRPGSAAARPLKRRGR
jgi:hypothetical protein